MLYHIVVVPCDNIPDVPNGKRSPAKDSVTCGIKVTHTCNEGFTLEGDSATAMQLQGQLPVCKTSGNFHLCNFMDIEH